MGVYAIQIKQRELMETNRNSQKFQSVLFILVTCSNLIVIMTVIMTVIRTVIHPE